MLLDTKTQIPPIRTKQVLRSRLFRCLDAGLRGKLTLVSAPAGFGKTTLIVMWIQDAGMPVAWLSLDREENAPVRFWLYFIKALQSIDATIGGSFLAALSAAQALEFNEYIPELLNEIGDSQDEFAIFLDDFHVIDNRQIQDMMIFFLDHAPANLHMLVSTRSDPPWPLPRLRARDQLTELRIEDLRFTSNESAAFMRDVMILDISSENVDALYRRTEGWIVGLQMAALSMQKRGDISQFIQEFTGTHRFILDYLLEEVLDYQHPKIQEFLLKTSILDRMSGDLCDAVLDVADSRSVLFQLVQANLFIYPLDEEHSWYRYHHLFSELLRNQLETTFPGQIPVLHQRASRWFDEQGSVEDAVSHARLAQDYERLARLIEKYARSMIQQNKYALLSSWIEILPEDLFRTRPWLCVYQSWTRHWVGRRDKGEDYLNISENMIDKILKEERNTFLGYIAAIRAHYALVNEHLSVAKEQAERALALLPAEEYHARGTAGVALGGAYWGLGDIARAEQAFRDCASVALKGGGHYRASSALCYMGMQQVKQAKLLEAERTFKQALTLSEDAQGYRHPMAGFSLAKLSELACEWNDLQQARRDAREGVRFCKQLGHVDLIAEAYVALARVQLAQNDLMGVEETLLDADRLSMQTKLDPWAVSWLDDCRIRLWLLLILA